MATHYPELDRIEIPIFYTPKRRKNRHNLPMGTVLVESSDPFSEGWVTVGFVSTQTPLGQGIFCGFELNELKIATPTQIRRALRRNHQHGPQFRPRCMQASDAGFHLRMSGAIRNWTNDNTGGYRPVVDVSRKQIQDIAEEAYRNHQELMERWDEITQVQSDAIRQHLNAQAVN